MKKTLHIAKAAGLLTVLVYIATGCGMGLTPSANGDEAANIQHPKDAAEFKSMIANGTVLVDFYADWCGPCRMMAPVLSEVAIAAGEKLKVIKVNVDHHRDLAQQYKVQSIPYLVLFVDGEIKAVWAGYQNKEQLTKWLSEKTGDKTLL